MTTYHWDMEHLEDELEKVDAKLADCKDNVEQIETWIEETKQRMAVATAMVDDAKARIARAEFGTVREARSDLIDAEQMIVDCTAALPKLAAQHARWQAAVTLHEDRYKQFPMAALRKQRKARKLQQQFTQARGAGSVRF